MGTSHSHDVKENFVFSNMCTFTTLSLNLANIRICIHCYAIASILFIVARLLEKVMSIVSVVCCLWCLALLGCYVCDAPPTV